MPRFHLDAPLPEDATTVTLDGREARHASAVFRLGVGRSLVLFDDSGHEYDATVLTVDRKRLELRIDARRAVDREPRIALTLAVGVPKGKRMTQLIRGCTELGVDTIVPLVCDRSVVKPRDRGDESPERWKQVAIEAAKQSGRTRVPGIEAARSLDDALDDARCADLAIFGALGPDTVRLREALAGLLNETTDDRPRVWIAIGPEGDFTESETTALTEAGARPVSLGPTILRVETAAVASAAAVLLFTDANA